MCKNWETSRTCHFGEKCCYAHGKDELKGKTHVASNFKTKVCTTFQEQGFCQFGNRCKFLHSQRDVAGKAHSYETVLQENVKVSLERAEMVKDSDDKLVYMNVFPTARLSVFSGIVKG